MRSDRLNDLADGFLLVPRWQADRNLSVCFRPNEVRDIELVSSESSYGGR